jgi:hypothetical protein
MIQPIQYMVPSYRRPELCRDATVATLRRLRVDMDRVTVYVASKDEARAYEECLRGACAVRVGELGLIRQRRFYNRQVEPGTRLVNVDDDLREVTTLTAAGKVRAFDGALEEIAEYAFGLCDQTGARLWGVNATGNGFYMDHSASVGLRYIVGAMFGSYAGDPETCGDDRVLHDSGEDFETCLRSYQMRGVLVRLDWVSIITKYFAPGGIEAVLGGAEARRHDHEKRLVEIADRYPGLATVYRKAGGVPNLRLKPVRGPKYPQPEQWA